MSLVTDCKEYHIACSRVKEYMRKFDFLHILRQYDITRVVGTISQYLKSLPENQQKFKLNVIRTFSTLTYFAWKGRKEYRDKYSLQPLPGYEHQIELMRSLYEKSRLVVRKHHDDSTSVEDCKIQPIVDIEEFEDINTEDIDIEDIDIKDAHSNSDSKTTDEDNDQYLKKMIYVSCKESLCYTIMEHQIMASLNDDIQYVLISADTKGSTLDKKKKLVYLWIQSMFTKIFKDTRRRKLLNKQFTCTNLLIASSTDVHFTYDDFAHIYTQIKEYRYQSTVTLEFPHIDTTFSDIECIARACTVAKRGFMCFISSDIETRYNKIGRKPKNLKEVYPKASNSTLHMILQLFNFDAATMTKYLNGQPVKVQSGSKIDNISLFRLASDFGDAVPLWLRKLFDQIMAFVESTR
jgi:hypothetical protein